MLQLPGGKKGERQLRQFLKPMRDRAIEEGLPEIPGAADVMAKMEKDVAGLKKKVKALESTSKKLWADKVQRDMAMAQKADN